MMRAALTAVLVSLALAPSAHAGWKQDRALAIANKVWKNPCAGQMSIAWTAPFAGLPPAALGWTDDCIIWLRTDRRYDWAAMCEVVMHEAGHVAGYRDSRNVADPDHSLNPGSIMFAERRPSRGVDLITGRHLDNTDRRCRARGRPYLGV